MARISFCLVPGSPHSTLTSVLGSEYPDDEEMAALESLSMLTAAVFDGVALQVQADPELDVKPAFGLLA
jgi:hypothetical protein